MRVAAVLRESIVDGPGIRTVIFFQGCPRHCPGCHNPSTLPFDGGTQYSVEALADEVIANLTPIHRGITLSGGDPLAQKDELLQFVLLMKKRLPDLNIWCYTGYVFEEVKDYPVLQYLDVLVDGPFVMAQRDLNLPFRGSANQRLLDLPATFATGTVQLIKR